MQNDAPTGTGQRAISGESGATRSLHCKKQDVKKGETLRGGSITFPVNLRQQVKRNTVALKVATGQGPQKN